MKTGFRLYFHQFWFGIGYGFDKTTGFVVSKFQMNKKERVMCEVEMDFKTSFCRRSPDLSNDDIISAYV